MKKLLAFLVVLLASTTLHAQGVATSNTAFRPGVGIAGVNVAVCQPMSASAASVTSNLATLTMSSNPQTAGFVAGMTIMVSGFTGADTYFNGGTITNYQIVGGFTILTVTPSTIVYQLTHANATASSTGAVLQEGNGSTGCAAMATLYTDSTLTFTSTNPAVTDGYGNYNVWTAAGQYWFQYYSSSVPASLRPVTAGGSGSGGTPGGSNTQVQYNCASFFCGAAGITYTAATQATTIQDSAGDNFILSGSGTMGAHSTGGNGLDSNSTQIDLVFNSTDVFIADSTGVSINTQTHPNVFTLIGTAAAFSGTLSALGPITLFGATSGSATLSASSTGSLLNLNGNVTISSSGISTFPRIIDTEIASGDQNVCAHGTGQFYGCTSSVTITFPQTVASATSGGIPYFSSTTVMSSSALLPTGDFVLGGGAGGAPTASFSIVPIANGGSNASTAANALINLNPVATRAGDVIYWDGSIWNHLAGNNSGTQCWQETSSGVPSWGTCGGSAALSAITAASGTNSINNANYKQTWNWKLTGATSIGWQCSENSASTGGTALNQYLCAFATLPGSTATPVYISNSLNGSQTLPALYVAPTWNTSGVADAAILINVADTASGTGSLLLDAQDNSTSEFNVTKVGGVNALGPLALGASTPTGCSATGCIAFNETGCSGTPTSAVDYICSSSGHVLKSSLNGGSELAIPQVIGSGTAAMGTSAISSGACATVVTVSATGVATTDTIVYTPNADPTGVTGYAVSATGSLYVWAYPTANNVNFKVCNNTAGSLTPSALTFNWRVSR